MTKNGLEYDWIKFTPTKVKLEKTEKSQRRTFTVGLDQKTYKYDRKSINE